MTTARSVRCRLCGSSDSVVLRRRLRHNVTRPVLRCESCGLVYLDRGLTPKKYAGKAYRRMYGPTLKRRSRPREIFDAYLPFQHVISERIAHLLAPRTAILDVGCSTGHFLHSLRGRVKTRVGVELDHDAVRFIRRNLDFPVYDRPQQTLDIPEGPFDIITGLQVLEHVDEPVEFLRSLERHLKPGGHLYLEVPNIDDVMLTQYMVKEYADFYYREAHVSYFSKRTLAKAVASAGFAGTIESVQRYSVRNHLTWMLARTPQDNYTLGNQPAWLVEGRQANGNAGRQLNAFMRKTDDEYKALIGQLGLGESLTFLGSCQDR